MCYLEPHRTAPKAAPIAASPVFAQILLTRFAARAHTLPRARTQTTPFRMTPINTSRMDPVQRTAATAQAFMVALVTGPFRHSASVAVVFPCILPKFGTTDSVPASRGATHQPFPPPVVAPRRCRIRIAPCRRRIPYRYGRRRPLLPLPPLTPKFPARERYPCRQLYAYAANSKPGPFLDHHAPGGSKPVPRPARGSTRGRGKNRGGGGSARGGAVGGVHGSGSMSAADQPSGMAEIVFVCWPLTIPGHRYSSADSLTLQISSVEAAQHYKKFQLFRLAVTIQVPRDGLIDIPNFSTVLTAELAKAKLSYPSCPDDWHDPSATDLSGVLGQVQDSFNVHPTMDPSLFSYKYLSSASMQKPASPVASVPWVLLLDDVR
ncbi:hypothetical protein FB45DRAFT_1041721 [Roridomyces roridus]|uniref:Uncharacterized protein n=1 Tax=Roridomyces roridus TaxID=1738132 RepID=A0AAD7F991_9AGAR|nr:hypothetical protein FB45DRAFT_1041721 [Roridomyces roridus]